MTTAERVGGIEKRALVVIDPDPTWPQTYQSHEDRIRDALDPRGAPAIEHIGSTSVPGLAAKPIVDIQAATATLEALCRTGCPC